MAVAGGSGTFFAARRRPSVSPFVAFVWSAVFSLDTAALLLLRRRLWAGLWSIPVALLICAGFASLPDRTTRRERFLGLVADRVFDASVLLPLAWVSRNGDRGAAVLALVGVGASFVASYERARAESLGYLGRETFGYRVARAAILVLTLLTGLLAVGLTVFALVCSAALAVRAWNVVLQERREGPTTAVPS